MLERIGHRLARSVLFWSLLLTLLSLYLTSKIRILLPFGKNIYYEQVQLHWILYVAVGSIWLTVFLLLRPQNAFVMAGLPEAVGRLLASVGMAGLSFAGLLYLSPFRDVSRLQFAYFIVCDLVILLALHVWFRAYYRSQQGTRWQQRVLIVGGSLTAQQIACELRQRPWAGLQVYGYAADEPPATDELPVLGTVDETVSIVMKHKINEVIFALPDQQHERVANLSLKLQTQPVMVHTVPGLLDLTFARTPVGTLAGIPLISLRESALNEPQRLMKRLFDMVLSALALILLSPLMLVVAVLIKFDSPGPVLFRQERIGEHGKRFQMLKFRSMHQDAEARWHEATRQDENGNLIHKKDGDARITRIGRTLRRSSLDELPQLINVLLGQMSLVGPRPEIPRIVEQYQAWQWQRFRIPPGMTGWWQINGRSDKPMHLHTEDDLFYVQNYSFWLDIQILLKTIIVVWRGQGAY